MFSTQKQKHMDMKRIIILISAVLVGLSSCTYDDTALVGRVENLEDRVTKLEKLCKEMNANIDAMAAIIEALETHDYITSVTPITKDGETVGYTITFAKDEPITIYHGEDGKDGVDGRQMLLGLIADQNAPPQGDVHWYDFLNHKTLFFEGGEQMAVKFNLPVLYLSMSRISAGKYRGEVILLYDGIESVEKHEITERYVRQLERDILREPAAWMWSHRRWKYYPDPVTGEPIYRRE